MSLNLVEIPKGRHNVPRDGYGRPLIVPKTGGKAVAHTRTTTFIDCIEDKSTLSDWGKRMAFLGASKFPELLDDVNALDPADELYKRKVDEIVEHAVELAGAHEKREKGTELHWFSEFVDSGGKVPDGASEKDLLDMAEYMLITEPLTFSHIETFVVMPDIGSAGTFDRRAHYRGPGPDGQHIEGWFITDLKTGSVEYGGLKMAAQLAAYAHGEVYDHTVFPDVDTEDKKAWTAWKKTEWDAELAATAYSPMPEVRQDYGIVVHLPSGESNGGLYWVDLRLGWELALLAKTIRAARGRKADSLLKFSANNALCVCRVDKTTNEEVAAV